MARKRESFVGHFLSRLYRFGPALENLRKGPTDSRSAGRRAFLPLGGSL